MRSLWPARVKGETVARIELMKCPLLTLLSRAALIAVFTLLGAPVFAQPAPESIKLENEFVRVLFLTDQPRTKTPLHRHEFNRVMIYLDPIELVLRYQDGEVDRQRWRKGQVAWNRSTPIRRLYRWPCAAPEASGKSRRAPESICRNPKRQ